MTRMPLRRSRACGHQLGASQHLLARRHQGLAVLERPAVVLHVRHLQPLGAEALGQLDDGRQAGDVLAMDRAH